MSVRGIERDAVKALHTSGKKMVKRAQTYSGVPKGKGNRVHNAIKYEVDYKPRLSASLLFFVDPESPNIMLKSKRYGDNFNLVWALNDGTYGNYSRGILSDPADTIGSVEGYKGLRHLDFMGRSWNLNEPKLLKRLEQIFIRLK